MRKEDIGTIRKVLMFTDAHWGCRNNSVQHLQDSMEYTEWLITIIKQEKPSHIAFLGDWFENRASVNIQTLNESHKAARMLDALGIPIIFIVGNHDLFNKAGRQIFSTDPYKDLKNFLIVNEPMELSKDVFVTPYIFKPEYPELVGQINSHKYVFGHFEFRGYVVTGASRVMDHGPDPDDFAGPKYIFSGHFHKRQANKNVIYIGNAFPTNFGDAGDPERGCCVLNVADDDVYFHDWPDAPLFFKTRLSQVLAGEADFPPKSRVRCLLDIEVGYSDVQALRDEMIKTLELREFSVEEDVAARKEAISEGLELEGELDLSSLDNTVRQLITEGVNPSPTIDPKELIALYEELT